MRAIDGAGAGDRARRDLRAGRASRAAARAMTALALMRLLPENGRVAGGRDRARRAPTSLRPARSRACATCAAGASA
ncbi:MAG: hypothetical protein MZW92_72730 [Comamonadaceae bacterium]|nr:hypothetical protein [Comamonadaceae bacterium]